MITDDQLATWERLTNEAQPRPWTMGDRYGYNDVGHKDFEYIVCRCRYPGGPPVERVAVPIDEASATFIMAAREAVPALIAEVRRLRAMLPCGCGCLSPEQYAQAAQTLYAWSREPDDSLKRAVIASAMTCAHAPLLTPQNRTDVPQDSPPDSPR